MIGRVSSYTLIGLILLTTSVKAQPQKDSVSRLLEKSEALLQTAGSDLAANRSVKRIIREAIALARAKSNHPGELKAINALRRFHLYHREIDSVLYYAR